MDGPEADATSDSVLRLSPLRQPVLKSNPRPAAPRPTPEARPPSLQRDAVKPGQRFACLQRSAHDRLRLYDYAASGNCYKARLLLAQLDRPYERVPVDIFAGETLSDEYAQINPARTTPVLETEHGYLPESNAILVYLAAGTPLLPDDPFELAQVVRWLIYEQTDVSPTTRGLRFLLLVGRLAPDDPEAVRGREGAQAVLRPTR